MKTREAKPIKGASSIEAREHICDEHCPPWDHRWAVETVKKLRDTIAASLAHHATGGTFQFWREDGRTCFAGWIDTPDGPSEEDQSELPGERP